MKIHLLLKRGLGNQMFQYAAGLFFAKRYGADLEIIRESQTDAFSFGHPRPFLLSNFCISTSVREHTKWDRLVCSVALAKKPLAVSARLASRTVVYRQHFRVDWTFLPDLPIAKSTEHVYVEGNFQAYQFAQDVEELLRKELTLRKPASGANLETLAQIRSVENSVSLHVRRGDYVVRNAGPQVLPLEYYAQSIQAILEKVNSPTFFVFSDDIAFASENLPNRERMVFVGHNDETNPHEDLRLMASCSHNIIANSTLSWWGAWLNPKPGKVVCTPMSWQNVDHSVPYPDLIPRSWLSIETDATEPKRLTPRC